MREFDTDLSYGKRKKGKETNCINSWNDEAKPKMKRRVTDRKESEEKNVYWNSEVQKRKSTKKRKYKVKERDSAKFTEVDIQQEKKLPTKKKSNKLSSKKSS